MHTKCPSGVCNTVSFWVAIAAGGTFLACSTQVPLGLKAGGC